MIILIYKYFGLTCRLFVAGHLMTPRLIGLVLLATLPLLKIAGARLYARFSISVQVSVLSSFLRMAQVRLPCGWDIAGLSTRPASPVCGKI